MKLTLKTLTGFALLSATLLSAPGFAAIDIADQPLINTATVTKPNFMFVLDDSGSMSRTYMPDDAWDTSKYVYWANQCNGLQYNPASNYPLPVTSTGATYPNMGFTTAWNDGFKASLSSYTSSTTSMDMGVDAAAGTTRNVVVGSSSGLTVAGTTVLAVDSSNYYRWMLGSIVSASGTTLTIKFTFSTDSASVTKNAWRIGKPSTSNLNNSSYYSYQGTQKALNWTYTGSAVDTSTDFYKECNKTLDTDTSKFTKVTVTTASSDTQKYANWYSYYRARYLMARSAGGRAMSGLNSNFRVGFTIISDEDSVTAGTNNFVDILDFTDSQKLNFYSNFYQVQPGGYTPLRTALTKVGKYYANKYSGQTDPIQYACQRNYTLLTTDGYWNDDTTYLTKIDSSSLIGQQDGTEAKPMWDGMNSILTSKSTRTKSVKQVNTSFNTKTTKTTKAETQMVSCTGSGTPSGTPSGTKNTKWSCTYKTGTWETINSIVTKIVATTTVTTPETRTIVTTNGVEALPVYTSGSSSTTNGSTTTTLSNTTTAYALSASGYGSVVSSPKYTYNCSSACTNPAGLSVWGSPSTGSPVNSAAGGTPGSETTTTYTDWSTSVDTPSTSGGSSNSLADVAEYFYKTDLRSSTFDNCTSGSSGNDVCNDEVPTSGRDTAQTQHMTTFTLGFGVNGSLTYDPNYLTQATGTYVDLVTGAKTWPVAVSDSPLSVDDLWHAAVNGRGQYFSASDPSSLATSLSTVINTISKVSGAGAAAASSSLKPVQGEDQIYVGSYTTLDWTGDLQAQTLNENAETKEIFFTDAWSAKTKLDALAWATRKIYYRGTDASSTSGLAPFDYTHLSADSLNAYFDSFCLKATTPDQCTTLSSTQIAQTSGANLVNYLRGERANEANSTGPLFRPRASVLGDIVGSGPVFVGKPPFKYADSGYSDFVSTHADRSPMVYVAANDGMLHAFSATSSTDGNEAWAYVPRMAMSNMYRLADIAYSSRHRFILDGTPVVGDIKTAAGWKSILVGGMGVGASGYYALDITDPANPKSLWEFTDSDLGKSFGNPIITKLANGSESNNSDGTWVVVFTSGLNNTGPGYLYVVDANTGVVIRKIQTKDPSNTVVGTSATPANLGEINAWVDNVNNNTAQRIYGGDMLGNLWRFDISGLVEPNYASLQLAKFQISSGSPVTTTPQPISTRPELANVKYGSNRYPVILVGTGRYLGSTDITNTTQQSMYAIKDPLTNTSWGDVRTNSNLYSQSITASSTTVTSTSTALDWSTKLGWKFDFNKARERLNTDMTLQYTTLVFSTTVPESTTCTPAGSSWDYNVDIVTGHVEGERAGNYMTVGVSTVALTTDGETRLITLRRKHTGETTWKTGAEAPKDSARRTSWRELID